MKPVLKGPEKGVKLPIKKASITQLLIEARRLGFKLKLNKDKTIATLLN